MAWLPEFTPEELEMLRKDRPDLLAILEDPSFWKKWDKVIKPANGLLWEYFEESIGIPAFNAGAEDASEQWKKFEGAFRPPKGYETWTGASKYSDAWFRERGAEFVTNISDTDRQKLKGLLIEHWGLGERQFAQKIKEEYLFSAERAKTIYRTEVHMTHEAGGLAFAADAGATTKVWLGNQLNPCSKCSGYNGEKRLIGEAFSNGAMVAHAHPRCRCTTIYLYEGTEGHTRRQKLSDEAFTKWQAGIK